jgi:threonine synthase
VPVGNGTLLYGSYLGLKELQEDDRISTLPRIIGVQAQNCAPLATAWKHHGTMKRQTTKQTIAEGIAITNPPRTKEILHAVKATKGALFTVTEQEIFEALHTMHRKGYFIEPTSAVAVAALKKIQSTQDDRVVIPLTGHGLKTKGIPS